MQGYSKLIRSLENELGVDLLVRSRTGVALTHSGEVLDRYARSISEQYEALMHELSETSPAPACRVKIHATYYAAEALYEMILQGLLPKDLSITEEPFSSIIDGASGYGPDELAIVDLHLEGRELLRRRGLLFDKFASSCLGVAFLAKPGEDVPSSIKVSDLEGRTIVCNSHREIARTYGRVLKNIPQSVALVTSSGLRSIEGYVMLNPDCLVITDSVAQEILRRRPAKGLGDVCFAPFESARPTITVGAVQRRGAKPSSAALSQMSQIKRTFRSLQLEGASTA